MTRTGDLEDKSSDKKSDEASTPEVGEVVFPFIAHGTKALPQQETVLIKNATVFLPIRISFSKTVRLLRLAKIFQPMAPG